MFFKACFFIFIKLNGKGASPLPIPTSLKSFYLKKKMIMCELKGGHPVNGIASELPMQRIGTFIVFFDNGNE